jgi:soluble lytic murein transglycosylase-like protein
LILILVWLLLIRFVFRPKETEGSTLADNFIAQSSLNIPEDKMIYQGMYVVASTSPSEVSAVKYLQKIAGDDFGFLYKVIQCESGWNPNAKNKSSTAGGLAQFLDSTWQSWGKGDKMNPYNNIDAMVRLYNARGIAPWQASKSCWQS